MMIRSGHPTDLRGIAAWSAVCIAVFFAAVVMSGPARAQADWTRLAEERAAALPERLHLAELRSVPRSHGPVSMRVVAFPTSEKPGTIVISNRDRTLHRVLGGGKAELFKISVGRDGFIWTGTTIVGRKAEWPAWRPPAAMRARQPGLPDYVPPGPYNPLGARALYLFDNGRDTLYRIHGTNDSGSLGGYQTSGCFRLSNADVMYLFRQVAIGTKVIVK